ncbi:MAG: GNAT family N-acetyltransferase [Candidatus Gracilibacteria bacterium]|jgi:GNAT superfamily N-acetyltransferase|nr:GNAT family N-acetyltransferase [Candidatus Gracilibacteria bacterium]
MPEIIPQIYPINSKITDFIIEILLKYSDITEKDTSKQKIITDLENHKYGEIFTIEDCEEIIGFFSLHHTDYGIFIHKLFINEEKQKLGTGTIVLNFLKESFSEIRLRVNTKNTAKLFYEKNGFISDHENEGYFTMIWKKIINIWKYFSHS